MVKYLFRSIGALCIIAALIMMIVPTCLKVDGMKSRHEKMLKGNTESVLESAEDALTDGIRRDAFQDDLEDNDLPSSKSKIKSRIKDAEDIAEDTLDGEYSLGEVLNLLWKAPGLAKDAQNLVNTDYALGSIMDSLAWEARRGNFVVDQKADPEQVAEWLVSTKFLNGLEDSAELLEPVPVVCYIALGVFALFGVLAVWAVVGHMLNKGRWGKYLLLALVVLVVVGTCVALPMLAGVIEEAADNVPMLKGVQLRMTAAPFCVIALMIVPIVLDIIFERKYKTVKAEEVKNG